MNKLYLLFLFLFTLNFAFSQVTDEDLIQLSGVVLTSDSTKPVAFTTVRVAGSNRGTVTDCWGFFSFVARKGDVVEFTSIGYKPALARIPKNLPLNRYSVIQVMKADTILMKEAVIYAWANYEQFKNAFIKLDPPEDDLDRAVKNLELIKLKESFNPIASDGPMNYKELIHQQTNKYYHAGGQIPPMNILSPLAWAKFIEAWKNGDFKRKQ